MCEREREIDGGSEERRLFPNTKNSSSSSSSSSSSHHLQNSLLSVGFDLLVGYDLNPVITVNILQSMVLLMTKCARIRSVGARVVRQPEELVGSIIFHLSGEFALQVMIIALEVRGPATMGLGFDERRVASLVSIAALRSIDRPSQDEIKQWA